MNLPTQDPYTNEWYREQFARLNNLTQHLHTAFLAELESNTHQLNALRKEVNELTKARQKDVIKIGELQERLDKASEYIRGVKKAKEPAGEA